MQKTVWVGIAGCVIAVIALSLVSFNMIMQNNFGAISSHNMDGGHDMGGMSGSMD